MSAVRFTVTKTEDDPMGESSTDPPANYGTDLDTPDVKIVEPSGGYRLNPYIKQLI